MPPAEATDTSQMVQQAKQQSQELLARGETMVADMLRGYLGQFQEYIGGSTTHGCSHAQTQLLPCGHACAEVVVVYVQERPGSWPYRLWSLAWTRP